MINGLIMSKTETVSLDRIAKALGEDVSFVESLQDEGTLWNWILTKIEEEKANNKRLAYYLRPVALAAGEIVKERDLTREVEVTYTRIEARAVRTILRNMGYNCRRAEDVK